MRLAFVVAPIAFGIDKFANVMVDWPNYLAPWINDIAPGSGQDFAMYLVGAIEILAGVSVALKPRYGAYIVAAWLAGIIINLLTYSGFYDVALRDSADARRADARPPRLRLRPAARSGRGRGLAQGTLEPLNQSGLVRTTGARRPRGVAGLVGGGFV